MMATDQSDEFRCQQGFGLLEVLIALLVISIGLLGMASLQTKATQWQMESYQRSQALILLEDMLNRINSNQTYVGCYFTSDSSLPGTWAEGTVGYNKGCNGISDQDLQSWNDMLLGTGEKLAGGAGASAGALINAVGCVDRPDASDTSLYRVSIAWEGLTETTASANLCGKSETRYPSDKKRRVVSALIRITKWK